MNQITNLNDVMRCMSKYALGGSKIPHSVSNPVFRKLENGSYALASFVFTFSREQLNQNTANAPCEWIVIDPITGDLIARNQCSNDAFSNQKEEFVDLKPESSIKFSKEYSAHTINLFNGLLSIYQANHVFDIGLNNAYMFMMLQSVSKGLKPYYNDLNLI